MILFFDIIGTIVDWHSSLSKTIKSINSELDVDKFVWGCMHEEGIIKKQITSSKWIDRDYLQKQSIINYVTKNKDIKLSEKEIDQISDSWNNCLAWPDCKEGLERLKSRNIICTLSNSTINQLIDLCNKNGLSFNFILSADLFKAYKPDPKVYIEACKKMNTEPSFCIMVAAHNYDLEAAAKCGLKTAFIKRNFGNDLPQSHKYNYVCNNLNELNDLIEEVPEIYKEKSVE